MIMVSDFSAERARIVRQLNQAGIPLVGIPLFPVEEGYYFTVDNAPGPPTATSSGSSGQPSTGWSGTGSGWTLNPRPSSTCS
jgi:hypothetical protein